MSANNGEKDRLLDSLPAHIILVDKRGSIRAANKKTEKLLEQQYPGRSMLLITDIFPELKKEEVMTGWKDARVLKMNGIDFVVITEANPLQQYEDSILLLFFELSDLASVNRELAITKKELEEIIDTSYDEILVADHDGYVLRVSAGACRRLYGEEPEKIIGRNVKELEKEGYYRPSIFDQVKTEKRRVTSIQTNKMGHKTIVTANPLLDENNNVIRVISNSRDINEFINLGEKLGENEKQARQFYQKLIRIKQDAKVTEDFVAESPNMQSIIETARKVAQFDSTVLLLGESGVGKDLVAKMIHGLSSRSAGPFQKINCGAIPDSLLESELFGYAPGAFTGALREGKRGLIEEAQGGTLYLDEIGEMPYFLQVKLLQVIEEKVVNRVGSSRPMQIDIRIIAATHKNLQTMAAEKKFREDLYYRLNVVSLHLPPLRERPEDLQTLCNLFIKRFNQTFSAGKGIATDCMKAFMRYTWPGNVRELENLIERFLVMGEEDLMQVKHLPGHMQEVDTPLKEPPAVMSNPAYKGFSAGIFENDNGYCSDCRVYAKSPENNPCPPRAEKPASLQEAVEKAEIEAILEAVRKHGKINKAARALGISQSTLTRRLNRYGITHDYAKVNLDKR